MSRVSKICLVVVAGVVAVAGAGPPMVSHGGQVLDAETGEPIHGVKVVEFCDESPDRFPERPVSASVSDSLGVYFVGGSCPGEVYFAKAGYDSLALHWPQEFGGDKEGGCGVTLKPVYLSRTKQ